MATLLGTLPSCRKSELERHGDGPKPGLTALAEPRKIRNAPKAPASASSADLQATGRDAGSFPSPEVSAAASSLPKDSPRGLIRAVELEKRAFFPLAVVPTACTAQPETPAPATPRHATRHHPPPLLEGAAASGTLPDSPSRMQKERTVAPNGSAAGASQNLLRTSASTHPVLRVIAQFDFLAQATGDLHGYTARADTGILSAWSEARGAEAGGGGAGRWGLLATELTRAVLRTRSCSRL